MLQNPTESGFHATTGLGIFDVYTKFTNDVYIELCAILVHIRIIFGWEFVLKF